MRTRSDKKRDLPSMTREEAMAMRPVRNRDAVPEEGGDGPGLILSYPVALRPWLAGLAKRFGLGDGPPRRRLQLDELGAEVWGLVDGDRSVREIAAALAARYGLGPREAELSVAQFLRELGRRGVIGFR